jgi:hypothetical protein
MQYHRNVNAAPLQCNRDDWIRTRDLLNPVQEPTPLNSLPNKADASSQSFGCTSGCTGETESANLSEHTVFTT